MMRWSGPDARVAVLSHSLTESTELRWVEPRAYLREATLQAARSPGAITVTLHRAEGVTV